MVEKLIVVIGATGAQGGSVARTFLKKPGWRVRGITRDLSKPAAQTLVSQGAEMISADLDGSVAALAQAFKGAHAVFAVTDFWQFPFLPSTAERAQREQRQPNEVAYDLELAQAKNIFAAVASPDVLPTLDRFVFSTLSATKRWSGGQITWNLHFDGKAAATDYLVTELPQLAAKTSFLQIGMYLDNWRTMSLLAPSRKADGTVIFRALALPEDSAGKRIPYVHPPTDTGPCVFALVQNAPAGTTLLGTSGELDSAEFVELFGRIKGVDARWQSMSKAELAQYELFGFKTVPDWLLTETVASLTYIGRFGYDGGDPSVKRPADVGVEMSELTTVEQYMRETDYGI